MFGVTMSEPRKPTSFQPRSSATMKRMCGFFCAGWASATPGRNEKREKERTVASDLILRIRAGAESGRKPAVRSTHAREPPHLGHVEHAHALRWMLDRPHERADHLRERDHAETLRSGGHRRQELRDPVK